MLRKVCTESRYLWNLDLRFPHVGGRSREGAKSLPCSRATGCLTETNFASELFTTGYWRTRLEEKSQIGVKKMQREIDEVAKIHSHYLLIICFNYIMKVNNKTTSRRRQ